MWLTATIRSIDHSDTALRFGPVFEPDKRGTWSEMSDKSRVYFFFLFPNPLFFYSIAEQTDFHFGPALGQLFAKAPRIRSGRKRGMMGGKVGVRAPCNLPIYVFLRRSGAVKETEWSRGWVGGGSRAAGSDGGARPRPKPTPISPPFVPAGVGPQTASRRGLRTRKIRRDFEALSIFDDLSTTPRSLPLSMWISSPWIFPKPSPFHIGASYESRVTACFAWRAHFGDLNGQAIFKVMYVCVIVRFRYEIVCRCSFYVELRLFVWMCINGGGDTKCVAFEMAAKPRLSFAGQ